MQRCKHCGAPIKKSDGIWRHVEGGWLGCFFVSSKAWGTHAEPLDPIRILKLILNGKEA